MLIPNAMFSAEDEGSSSGRLPPYLCGMPITSYGESNPSTEISLVLNSSGGIIAKFGRSFFVKSNTSSHLLTYGFRPAAYTCSLRSGYPMLYGAKVRLEEASIIGSFIE